MVSHLVKRSLDGAGLDGFFRAVDDGVGQVGAVGTQAGVVLDVFCESV